MKTNLLLALVMEVLDGLTSINKHLLVIIIVVSMDIFHVNFRLKDNGLLLVLITVESKFLMNKR
jgi:hypothetical protein